MRQEIGSDRARLAISEIGVHTSKKKKNYENIHYRLKTLCERFSQNLITLDEFLVNIGHNIRKRSF